MGAPSSLGCILGYKGADALYQDSASCGKDGHGDGNAPVFRTLAILCYLDDASGNRQGFPWYCPLRGVRLASPSQRLQCASCKPWRVWMASSPMRYPRPCAPQSARRRQRQRQDALGMPPGKAQEEECTAPKKMAVNQDAAGLGMRSAGFSPVSQAALLPVRRVSAP